MLSTRPVPITICRVEKEKLWAPPGLEHALTCVVLGTGANTSARIRLSWFALCGCDKRHEQSIEREWIYFIL